MRIDDIQPATTGGTELHGGGLNRLERRQVVAGFTLLLHHAAAACQRYAGNGCQLNHEVAALAIDALGEYGVLKRGSKHVREQGNWQNQYMFTLGLIIGGGTAQIQKNIISERGLGMPREPKPAVGRD